MSNHGILRWRSILAATAIVALAGALAAYIASDFAQASHQPNHEPADKVQVAAANDVRLSPGAPDQVILRERIRTAKPTDLLLSLTSECGIALAQVDGPPTDSDFATAFVSVRVKIDGQPVTVVGPPDDPPGAGDVALCQRTFADNKAAVTESTSETDITLASHGFNWAKLNVGSGLHEVTVHADLTEVEVGTGISTLARIDNRTLTIEPTKMAVGQDKTIASP